MDSTAAGRIIRFDTTPNDNIIIGGYKIPKNANVSISNGKIFSEAIPVGPSTRFGKLDYFSVDTFLNYSNWKINIDGVYVPDSANENLVYKEMKKMVAIYKIPTPLPIVSRKINSLGILAVWIRSLDFPNQDVIWELPFKMECSSFIT